MFSVITEPQEQLAAWLGEKFDCRFFPPYIALGFAWDGELKGVGLLHNFTADDIEVSFYGKFALTRRVLKILAAVIFHDNRCLRCTCRVRASNVTMQRLLKHAGFIQEGRQRKFYGNEDCLLFGLLKEECRWL